MVVHKLTSQKYQRTLVPCINHVGSDQHQHFSWAYFVPINLLSMFDDKLWPDLTIWVSRRVCYKKQELITLREHLGQPPVFIGGARVGHSFLCCVFALFVCLRQYKPNVATVFELSIRHCSIRFSLALLYYYFRFTRALQ